MATLTLTLCSLARLPTVQMFKTFVIPHRTMHSSLHMMSVFSGPRQSIIEERLAKASICHV